MLSIYCLCTVSQGFCTVQPEREAVQTAVWNNWPDPLAQLPHPRLNIPRKGSQQYKICGTPLQGQSSSGNSDRPVLPNVGSAEP